MIHVCLVIGFWAMALGIGAEDRAGLVSASNPGPETPASAGDSQPSPPSHAPALRGQEALEQAVALAASGQAAKARDLLAAITGSEDSQLAAAAHYNLGCLAAQDARELFGTAPEQLLAAHRNQGLALLAEACEHFRECLRHDPQHADARHNLELLRLWIGAHRQLWRTEGGTQLATAPKPSQPSSKPKPKPAARQAPEGQGKPGTKAGSPGASAQAAQAPAKKPQPAGDSSASASPPDPPRQYAEDLMAKVRHRIDQRRQREQSRWLPRWNQGDEKDW